MLRVKQSKRHTSKAERLARLDGWRPELEGREAFLRENAVVLVAMRDAQIVNMRKEIRRLRARSQSLQHELALWRRRRTQ